MQKTAREKKKKAQREEARERRSLASSRCTFLYFFHAPFFPLRLTNWMPGRGYIQNKIPGPTVWQVFNSMIMNRITIGVSQCYSFVILILKSPKGSEYFNEVLALAKDSRIS